MSSAMFDSNRMEANLTERERAFRDVFVSEYMSDFDAFKACVRMGFLHSFAIDMAQNLMKDGYVLRKINYMTKVKLEPSEEDKAEMLANLKWLSHNGSGAVRAQATKLYMEAQGYLKPSEDRQEEQLGKLAEMLSDFGRNAPV